MRLISQDGMIDVPYENVIINCEKNMSDSYTIYAEASHCFSLAVYSTKAKAIKVMEMLRNEYSRFTNTYNIIFKFPADEEVEINNGLE